jgi:acyl dehydratase
MKAIDQDAATVTRRAIVQYAGVVQDFNPVHYDDEFARKAGLPVLDALVGLYGAQNIAGVKARLKAPVVPGDRLHLKSDEQGALSVSVGSREVLAGTVLLKD